MDISKLRHLKYLSQSLTKKERYLIYTLIVIIVACLCWWGRGYYFRHTEIAPTKGGRYIEGLVGQPKYINPILCQTNDVDMDLATLVFSGLMKYNAKQELVPDLAERYEISEDQKNYTFYLRKGIKWHDGQELTADDVVFTVRCIKNKDFRSPLLPSFLEVAVEKIDDYTVKFTLTKKPFVPFLRENTTFGILPKHIWEKILPENFSLAKYNLEPMGTGPFKFEEYKKDKEGNIKSYSLVLNEDYFGEVPYLEEITFKLYEDYPELIEAFNLKEILGISFISQELKDEIKKDITLYSLKLPRLYALFFNQPKNECLQDKQVRQALAYATPKQKIIDEVFEEQGSVVHSPILPNFLGYNPEIKKYEYNPDKGHEILHQAGWKEIDEQGKRWKEGRRLEVALTCVDQPEFIKVAEIIKESWESLGMVVHIKPYESAELQVEIIKPREYEVLLYGQLLAHDPDPYPFWHSSQRIDPGLNLTSFKNPEIDELLETARQTSDEEERKAKYLHFQNTITGEIPAIFLYSPTYLYGVDEKIKGIELDYVTYPSDRFAETNRWYVKTGRAWKRK